MSNSGDDQPLAPRRPLGKSASSTDTPQRPGDDPSYADRPRRYTAADLERTGQMMPVSPAAKGDGAAGGDGDGVSGTERAAAAVRSAAATAGALGSAAQARLERAREKASAKAAERLEQRRQRAPKRVRRARLRLTRVDPWSVTKTAFLLSIAFGIMCCVAVFFVFSIMGAAGLWDHINQSIQGVIHQKSNVFNIKDYVGMNRVMGIAVLVSAVDVIILTALATLGAFIYNLAASVLGGIEVTLAEDVR